MRKPIFLSDIDRIGEYFWIEIEGYEHMAFRPAGSFGGTESEIMGWKCETLADIFKKEREVNYAPRIRYWRGEEEPTAEERAVGRWENESRCWMPNSLYIQDDDTKDERWQEFIETGRTQWPVPPDPEDPVALNAELAAEGKEPLAPMCAGCHWGKWKHGTNHRWCKLKTGKKVFMPCVNIGVSGWHYWNKNQEQPPECQDYCKIGEYVPRGFAADMKKVIQAVSEAKV